MLKSICKRDTLYSALTGTYAFEGAVVVALVWATVSTERRVKNGVPCEGGAQGFKRAWEGDVLSGLVKANNDGGASSHPEDGCEGGGGGVAYSNVNNSGGGQGFVPHQRPLVSWDAMLNGVPHAQNRDEFFSTTDKAEFENGVEGGD